MRPERNPMFTVLLRATSLPPTDLPSIENEIRDAYSLFAYDHSVASGKIDLCDKCASRISWSDKPEQGDWPGPDYYETSFFGR